MINMRMVKNKFTTNGESLWELWDSMPQGNA